MSESTLSTDFMKQRGSLASTNAKLDQDERNVYINDIPINKNDFLYAFHGGSNQGELRKFGNPVPAGILAFSLACLTLGLIHFKAGGVSNTSVIIGACFFSAGVVEFVSGIWCLLLENTFGATVFLTYFGFWTSFGAILCDSFGIKKSYNSTLELNVAIGLFLVPYVVIAFLIWLCTLKSTWLFTILFFNIFLFSVLTCAGYLTSNEQVNLAAGVFSLLSGISGFYNAFAGITDPSNSYFVLRPWFMPGAIRPREMEQAEEQLGNVREDV